MMIVTRTMLPSSPLRASQVQLEIFVAECEACGFSAVSHYEHDAVAIVERHQAKCAKFLEAKATGKTSGAIVHAGRGDAA